MTDKDIEPNVSESVEARQVEGEMDVASKSLTNALGISFSILKIIMALLVLLFLASGIFEVESNEQAIVLRFGKMRGEPLGPGLKFGFPAPIDEIIKIPVTDSQTLSIDSLWYSESPAEKLGGEPRRPGPTLKPNVDGYCLTRNDSILGQEGMDYNIVHCKWVLNYTIDFPERFFRNIYYKSPDPGQDLMEVMKESLDPMLKALAADAVVTTMVNYSIDEAILSTSSITNAVKIALQERLNSVESGIVVESIVPERIIWPRQVNDAFENSNRASQNKQKQVSEADGYARKLLSEAGGPDAAKLLAGLKKEGISEEEKAKLLSQVAGKSQEIIAEARAYRTDVVESAAANADYLKQLLPEYRKRPKLVLQELYQDAIEEVLANADEKILIEPSSGGKKRELRIQINRDPSIGKKKLTSE